MEKDCVGSGSTGLGLGTRVPLPPGRITGSASIETLVRVGIEKENGLSPDSKMVIVHDFTPCVDDELQVKRGQVPKIINSLFYFDDSSFIINHILHKIYFYSHNLIYFILRNKKSHYKMIFIYYVII